jgi:hypothetical protein
MAALLYQHRILSALHSIIPSGHMGAFLDANLFRLALLARPCHLVQHAQPEGTPTTPILYFQDCCQIQQLFKRLMEAM